MGEFTLNAGTPSEVTGISHNGSVEWKTVATGSGTLISLTGVGPGNFTVWDAVEIDGVILTDPTGDNKLSKSTPYDTKLTVASDKDLANMTGEVFMSDGSGAPGPYTQTPYKLVTSEIESVVENAFAATYTGSPFAGYEGSNAFDRSEDKIAFPNGSGPLDQNNADEKSTRAQASQSVIITLNEDIEVTASSSIYVLYMSEANASTSQFPSVVVYGRNGDHTVSNDGLSVESNIFKWAQIPASIGDIWKIEINSESLGIAGLAQVKVNGANIVEGQYS